MDVEKQPSKMIFKNVFSMQQEINNNKIKNSKRFVTESDGNRDHVTRADWMWLDLHAAQVIFI